MARLASATLCCLLLLVAGASARTLQGIAAKAAGSVTSNVDLSATAVPGSSTASLADLQDAVAQLTAAGAVASGSLPSGSPVQRQLDLDLENIIKIVAGTLKTGGIDTDIVTIVTGIPVDKVDPLDVVLGEGTTDSLEPIPCIAELALGTAAIDLNLKIRAVEAAAKIVLGILTPGAAVVEYVETTVQNVVDIGKKAQECVDLILGTNFNNGGSQLQGTLGSLSAIIGADGPGFSGVVPGSSLPAISANVQLPSGATSATLTLKLKAFKVASDDLFKAMPAGDIKFLSLKLIKCLLRTVIELVRAVGGNVDEADILSAVPGNTVTICSLVVPKPQASPVLPAGISLASLKAKLAAFGVAADSLAAEVPSGTLRNLVINISTKILKGALSLSLKIEFNSQLSVDPRTGTIDFNDGNDLLSILFRGVTNQLNQSSVNGLTGQQDGPLGNLSLGFPNLG